MITSIFSKSKPINFIVVFAITVGTFFIAHFKYAGGSDLLQHYIKYFFIFCASFCSILVLDFLVSKNKLTQKSSYEILLYALFLMTLPQTMLNENIVYANFFILLALRRILSLRSQIDVKKKLLDAAFWIAIASLFYFWSILFIFLIYVALLFHSNTNLKEWIIPILGVAAVFVLGVCYSIIVYNDFFKALDLLPVVNLNFNSYNTLQYIVGVTLLVSFGIWSSVFYIRTIKSKKSDFKPAYKVVLVAALIAFSLMILSPKKEGGEFLFSFAPLAIIITNYLETIQDKWFKEIFLGLLIFVPFGLLLL
ncbi:DUF6427 family protein [Formosa algae]|uniref:Magnesium-transporting ATPase (P-type) n=1 Tax=Formosa algae TaxID=225843 RepID=A0A9X0YIQ5_9FLAO|nr:DUF6427 family protein [Formosa algae]MBP1838588.1 magnesium-transporting ATPase (P-type) [Formosa algae]MDQ0335088.1 magnesium-transporting ATPase (P-type) [Formosa algae]OEI79574.1 hypothetical protein AST99_13475 [Formosa algae]PNW30274.1 hypothetical protein BKP44_01115 [Formosa algae]